MNLWHLAIVGLALVAIGVTLIIASGRRARR